MTRAYPNPGRPNGQATPSGQQDRGELDLFDVIALAWSEKGFIALVFAVIFAIGAAASLTLLKPSFTAESRLLILLENDPTPTAAGAGGAFMLPQIMQSESELLGSDAVRRLALETVGPAMVLGAEAVDASPEAALKALRSGFTISREPNSSALIARFEANNPDNAAVVLNALVDAYLAYREQILIQTGVDSLVGRRAQADIVVAESRTAIDAFLTEHRLANFPTDKAAAETSVSVLQDRLRTSRADRDAALAGATALRDRIANIPANIALYIDNGASNRLLDRRVERQQLLARYQPSAPPVIAIEREISALEALIASGATNNLGTVRTGINPVRQAMETDLSTRMANGRAEGDRVTLLEQQVATAQREVARLRGLEPAYTRLAQNAVAAEAAAGEIAGQEAVAAARRSLGPGAADAVRVFDRATPPLEGASMKKLGLIASFVLAAGAALFLGLIRAYWNAYIGARRLAVPQPMSQPGAPPQPQAHPAAPVQAAAVAPANDVIIDLPILARIADRAS
jgi:uncharacterized protein involved in exopolysaccharide biosynthesis